MVPLRSHLAGITAALVFALALVAFSEDESTPAIDNELLDRWFEAQSKLSTWSADLVQVRTLKALKKPLRTPGKVWFKSPNQFRWEIGEPTQTIAVREPDALIVIYPRLKRAEQYPLKNVSAGRWRDALTLLESGFPRSREALERDFEITSLTENEERAELAMVPRSADTRRMLAEVRIGFDTMDMMLRSTELRFADESSMRNEFVNMQSNPELGSELFQAELPEEFKVSEPLSQR